MTPEPQMSATQYVHFLCGLPLAEIAVHTARNTAKVAEELAGTPAPPWLKHLTPGQ